VGELGRTSDDGTARRPGVDATIPELVGHAIGRNLTPVRITAGLAVTIAALGMVGLFAWVVAVPDDDDDDSSPLAMGESCFSVAVVESLEGYASPRGGSTSSPTCAEIDPDVREELAQAREERAQAREREQIREDRLMGTVGALVSLAALVLGWRVWRPTWRQGRRAGRRGRFVVAAVCLSPVAAFSILMAFAGLYRSYHAIFE
jgi:hypothetical protein